MVRCSAGYAEIYTNTDIGFLFAGTMADENEYNYGLGLDATYNQKSAIFTLQGALSDKNKKRDWALSGGYSFYPKYFLLMGREIMFCIKRRIKGNTIDNVSEY